MSSFQEWVSTAYLGVLDLAIKSAISLDICESLGLRNVPSFLQKSTEGEFFPRAEYTHTQHKKDALGWHHVCEQCLCLTFDKEAHGSHPNLCKDRNTSSVC